MLARAPVSVLIPCYCCADTVGRAVASAMNQTLPPAQIVLVEDASPDGGRTLAALERLASEHAGRVPVQVIRMPTNGGPGAARNLGWEAATQPYIAFLDADDVWHPSKLELQIGWMEAHPEVALTGSRSAVIRSMGDFPQLSAAVPVKELRRADILLTNPLPTRSVVLRAGLAQRFVPAKRYSEDYLLWATILLSGQRAAVFDAPLAFSFKRDFGEGGLSSHLWRMQRELLDTYRRLHAAGHIGWGEWLALDIVSWLKFVRRVAITMLTRISNRGVA